MSWADWIAFPEDDTEHGAFLRGIKEQPTDAVRQMVYADWLDERIMNAPSGTVPDWIVARSEFIRLCFGSFVSPKGLDQPMPRKCFDWLFGKDDYADDASRNSRRFWVPLTSSVWGRSLPIRVSEDQRRSREGSYERVRLVVPHHRRLTSGVERMLRVTIRWGWIQRVSMSDSLARQVGSSLYALNPLARFYFGHYLFGTSGDVFESWAAKTPQARQPVV